MIEKFLLLFTVVVANEALLDNTGCPVSFKKQCTCGMAYSIYDNSRVKRFTVNCTNAWFTETSMLQDLPEQTEVLIFVGNSIATLPVNVLDNNKDYGDLEVIDLSNNHIQFIQGKTFHKVYNVRTLILDHNDIDITDRNSRPRILSNFESLERLHMTNAFSDKINASDYLLNLEDIFYDSELVELKVLHLEQNEIWDIGNDNEQVFCQLRSLEQVLLGDNRLTDFNFKIDCLPKLIYIDLERNMISRLSDKAMERLDKYNKTTIDNLTVNLDDNPFNCDCRTTDFLDWLKVTKVDIPRWREFECIDGYPYTNVEKTFNEIQDLHCPTSSSSTSSSHSSSNQIRSSNSRNMYNNNNDSNTHSSATVGVLAFLLVFTTSMLLAVAYFHRKKMKNLFMPYWDFVTRKIGYTGIANEEAPQEVNV